MLIILNDYHLKCLKVYNKKNNFLNKLFFHGLYLFFVYHLNSHTGDLSSFLCGYLLLRTFS